MRRIIPQRDDESDQRRMNVNNMLKTKCQQNGFTYLDNSNIPKHLLWKDGIHLSDGGVCVFANNLINILKKSQ